MTPQFDIDALSAGVPEGRLKRADNYYDKGWVEVVEVAHGQVLAHVRGESGVYVVQLGEADGADARCDCPDFTETHRPCKHVVATALAANDLSAIEVRRTQQRLGGLAERLALEGYKNAETLVDMAREDPRLLRLLESAGQAES